LLIHFGHDTLSRRDIRTLALEFIPERPRQTRSRLMAATIINPGRDGVPGDVGCRSSANSKT
jgi:hypothetical protein